MIPGLQQKNNMLTQNCLMVKNGTNQKISPLQESANLLLKIPNTAEKN